MGGFVDYGQQACVDMVTVGQAFIQIHRADNRTDVGHGKVGQSAFQIADLVSGLSGVNHLIECHRVGHNHGVVFGDHLLRVDV